MASLLDASLWIDLTRWRSPRSLKEFIAPYVLDPEACIAEPVVFEVLNDRPAQSVHAQSTDIRNLFEIRVKGH